MSPAPKLIDVHVPRAPEAAVLVLHGGASRGDSAVAVSPTQLSVLRMVPIAHAIARADRRRLAVFRLLNSTRGWDASHTPVDDVAWAVEQLADRFPSGLPLGLVGHSLGGRAALLSAPRQRVRSVVALNPWVYADDGDVAVRGVRVLVVHGSADRIASPERSRAVADRLAATARSVSYVDVRGGKHAMLSRASVFSSLAATFSAAALLDPPPRMSDRLRRLIEGGSEPVTV